MKKEMIFRGYKVIIDKDDERLLDWYSIDTPLTDEELKELVKDFDVKTAMR